MFRPIRSGIVEVLLSVSLVLGILAPVAMSPHADPCGYELSLKADPNGER